MLPFRHIAVEMKSLTGPFRAGPAMDPWASTDPFRKVIFTLLYIEGCVREFLCTCWGRQRQRQRWVGCERQKWWAENEERRHQLAFTLDEIARRKRSYLYRQIGISCVIKVWLCLLICFRHVLSGWMKVIHSERGRQCIHRAEIMLLFGYLCSP